MDCCCQEEIEKENGYPSADGDEEDDNELENGDDGLKGLFWQFWLSATKIYAPLCNVHLYHCSQVFGFIYDKSLVS